MDLLISGGIVLLAIALLSIYAVYLFLVRFFKLSRERLDADQLMTRVNAAVRDRDLELALDACEQHGGPVARVLHAALLRLPYGRQAVEAAFQEASLQEEQRLTRGLRPLATIAQVAPLMGLLGTVTGMIIAFGEISVSGTGNPAVLAGGIGQALVTTAAGLIVAIPTLIGQNFLASRVDTILLEIDRRREELMANVVQTVAARKDKDDAGTKGAAAPRANDARTAPTAPADSQVRVRARPEPVVAAAESRPGYDATRPAPSAPRPPAEAVRAPYDATRPAEASPARAPYDATRPADPTAPLFGSEPDDAEVDRHVRSLRVPRDDDGKEG